MLLKHHPAACGYGELFSKHKFGANVVWLVVDLSSGPMCAHQALINTDCPVPPPGLLLSGILITLLASQKPC